VDSHSISLIKRRPSGRIVTVAYQEKVIDMWDRDGSLHTSLLGHRGSITSLTVGPDGTMVSGSNDYTARVWDADGSPRFILAGHTKCINCVALGIDGTIVTGSDDMTARVWNNDGTLRHILRTRYFKDAQAVNQVAIGN